MSPVLYWWHRQVIELLAECRQRSVADLAYGTAAFTPDVRRWLADLCPGLSHWARGATYAEVATGTRGDAV